MQVLLDTVSVADARGAAGAAAADGGRLTDEDLAALYAVPRRPWLRATMVSTVDGSATGEDGLSGSINNAADGRVFAVLRALADVVVVGVGTAEAEGYSPAARPLVVVSRTARVPATLRGAPAGTVLLATCSGAEGLGRARELLGAEHVLTCGERRVDLSALRAALVDRGWPSILCEGGPRLLRDAVAQGVVDELATTIVPRVIAGAHPRITAGAPVDAGLSLRLLLEDRGTLLARWFL